MKLKQLQEARYRGGDPAQLRRDAIELLTNYMIEVNKESYLDYIEEEGPADFATYGTDPEVVEIYLKALADEISEKLEERQKHVNI